MNKDVIGVFKDEIGGKVMTELIALIGETYFCLMYDGSSIQKAKGTNKCVIDRETKFNDYKNSLSNNEIILKSQQRFKTEADNLYTEEINKIALSSNDDKRLQAFDKVTTYP